MLKTIGLPILAFVVAAVLWVSQCSGPKPMLVGSPQVEPPDQPGDPYRVRTTVRNSGPGHGEVRVTVRLIDSASGEAYQKDDTLQLQPSETARVVVEIPAPPSDYEPDVEVESPPR